MKQRIADALQLAGAAAGVAGGFSINATVGLFSAMVSLVALGYVVERS